MRDYQRKRFYASILGGPRIENWKELNAYVDKLTRSAWWKKRFGPRKIRVHDGRGRRAAAGGNGVIYMPRWSRMEPIILEEIAHNLAGHAAGHGPKFVGIWLGLLDKQMGREHAERQMRALRANNVDWTLPAWWRH